MSLRCSKSMLYAIHALYFMSFEEPNRPVMAREICMKYTFPYDSVLRVLRQLTKAKILVAHRGSRGGFTPRVAVGSITLLTIVEVLDGPIEINDPLLPGMGNSRLKQRACSEMRRLSKDLRVNLGQVYVQQLFKGAESLPGRKR